MSDVKKITGHQKVYISRNKQDFAFKSFEDWNRVLAADPENVYLHKVEEIWVPYIDGELSITLLDCDAYISNLTVA